MLNLRQEDRNRWPIFRTGLAASPCDRSLQEVCMDFADGLLTEITCSCGREVFAVDMTQSIQDAEVAFLSARLKDVLPMPQGQSFTPPICFHSPFFSEMSCFVP